MSYYVNINSLKRWLDKSQLSLLSKNKVRKDLWTDLGDIILFEEGDNTIPLSSSEFITISTFLQTEGRADSITDDKFLSWLTTLNDLRRRLNKEIGIRSEQLSQVTEESTPRDEKKDDKQQLKVET